MQTVVNILRCLVNDSNSQVVRLLYLICMLE